MNDEVKLSKLEHIKDASRQLRGTIAEELANDEPNFTADAIQLIKFHGSYQQDNRDLRKAKNPDGTRKGKQFSCCLLYTSPSPRDATLSRMPSSA